MNWGLRITLLYLGFVALILTLVGLTMRQKVDLVSKDYYQQELQYQQRIDRTANTSTLSAPPSCTIQGSNIVLTFPGELRGKEITGTILFFRPSDASKDRTVAISVDAAGTQAVPMAALSSGMYKMQLEWKAGTLEFYHESILRIP